MSSVMHYEQRRMSNLRRAIWEEVERLEGLNDRMPANSGLYRPQTAKAIDETVAALVRAHALPLIPIEINMDGG